MRRIILSSLVVFLFACSIAQGEGDPEPNIIIFTAGDPVFAGMLADLITQDDRIDSEVEVVSNPEVIIMASLLPNTECIVIYSDHKDQVNGLYTSLSLYLQQGGGLVGMREVCYEPSALELAEEVFPVFANDSNRNPNSKGKRARTYIMENQHEVTSGLPETFDLLSMGTYISADDDGNYLPVPGDYEIVYRDEVSNSPLLVTHESEKGGRSVSMPGIWCVNNQRVDVYYGNLVAEDNFVRLFTNSVLWAAKGSTRYDTISTNLTAKLENSDQEKDELRRRAEEADKDRANQRLILLIIVWGTGIVVCVLVIWKLVLAPVETA